MQMKMKLLQEETISMYMAEDVFVDYSRQLEKIQVKKLLVLQLGDFFCW